MRRRETVSTDRRLSQSWIVRYRASPTKRAQGRSLPRSCYPLFDFVCDRLQTRRPPFAASPRRSSVAEILAGRVELPDERRIGVLAEAARLGETFGDRGFR